jgi:hypothetical protein
MDSVGLAPARIVDRLAEDTFDEERGQVVLPKLFILFRSCRRRLLRACSLESEHVPGPVRYGEPV